MAQKVQVILVDDIDGGAADETVSFSLDGVSYEIDLSTTNAANRNVLVRSLASIVESLTRSRWRRRPSCR